MQASEIRKLTDDQLPVELARSRTELFDLRSQAVTGKVDNTGQFLILRRDIARLLTEQSVRRNKAKATKPQA